jgi:hypothetical protein
MLLTLARRAAQPSAKTIYPFDVHTNPYTAKNPWPPDFAKLSDKHQFRLERRYKRRAQLKWARPNWMIATRLAQYVLGGGILVYGVLWMDWGEGNEQAFAPIRNWYKDTMKSIWTTPQRPRLSSENEQFRKQA